MSAELLRRGKTRVAMMMDDGRTKEGFREDQAQVCDWLMMTTSFSHKGVNTWRGRLWGGGGAVEGAFMERSWK